MQKKINCIEEEYNEIIKDKSQEEIENINNDIIAKCTKVINNDNEKFYDEKNKIYEKFKSLKVENKQSISKLKKILLFRTHSKKTKKYWQVTYVRIIIEIPTCRGNDIRVVPKKMR